MLPEIFCICRGFRQHLYFVIRSADEVLFAEV